VNPEDKKKIEEHRARIAEGSKHASVEFLLAQLDCTQAKLDKALASNAFLTEVFEKQKKAIDDYVNQGIRLEKAHAALRDVETTLLIEKFAAYDEDSLTAVLTNVRKALGEE
jgi:hypothetical protein